MRKPFYGWIIVGVSFLISITESGVFQNILSIFMKPMVDELGWTRASVTGAMAFGSVMGGLLSLVVGPLIDRHGPRMLAFGGITLLCLGLVAMTFADHIWQLYVFFGIGRMIAVGLLTLVTSVSIANWFVRLRGRAMGIARIGDRFGATLLPLLVQFLILTLGWRWTWGTLGIILFLISGLPSLLFLRHKPEDMGLLPDGGPSGAGTDVRLDRAHGAERGDAPDLSQESVWSRTEAMRTGAFWVLTVVGSLIPFMQAGINFHTYPFLTDEGLSETAAVLVLSTFAVFGMAGSLVWGFLAERFPVRGLMAANVVGNGLIFLAFYWAVLFRGDGSLGIALIFLFTAVHGLIHGGRLPMLTLLWADTFGRRSLGTISGLANPFYFAANAIGPIFAGICFDLFGSYAIAFYVFVVLYFLTGGVTLLSRPAKKPGSAC